MRCVIGGHKDLIVLKSSTGRHYPGMHRDACQYFISCRALAALHCTHSDTGTRGEAGILGRRLLTVRIFPSLITLLVSVDVRHHVYLLTVRAAGPLIQACLWYSRLPLVCQSRCMAVVRPHQTGIMASWGSVATFSP